ncbi:MAG TPA: CinA family protein [Anaerolineales bacterium]|nr:CinA family protein [Anaerolineae bacterium]HIQ01927.1 CinA family protein [Anaerolineales bacterium]
MEEPLEVVLGRLLRERGLTLAVAESCTGGLIGHRITDVPGSSAYYVGSVTAYAYEAKEILLGVRHNTLYEHGAVSRETALEMARGIRRVLRADLGLAVTGIAGPGGGTEEKPVGLVYIALSAPEGEWVERHVWEGGRQANKAASAEAALDLVRRYLEGKTASGGLAGPGPSGWGEGESRRQL